MESLEILLEQASRIYSDEEKQNLAAKKNEYYRQMLNMLSPADILPGVHGFLAELKQFGIKSAIASSSKNTPAILERIGMTNSFDAIADGNDILRSKPDPEVFLLAAHRLNIRPEHCFVVEDATAGVEAALNAGMKVLAVGQARFDSRASCHAQDLSTVSFSTLKSLCWSS
jgi:beta-phosphoglucomutase